MRINLSVVLDCGFDPWRSPAAAWFVGQDSVVSDVSFLNPSVFGAQRLAADYLAAPGFALAPEGQRPAPPAPYTADDVTLALAIVTQCAAFLRAGESVPEESGARTAELCRRLAPFDRSDVHHAKRFLLQFCCCVSPPPLDAQAVSLAVRSVERKIQGTEIMERVGAFLQELTLSTGQDVPRGMVLWGPPGTGHNNTLHTHKHTHVKQGIGAWTSTPFLKLAFCCCCCCCC